MTDNVDLDSLRWRTGGYDKTELSNLYTFSGSIANRRADLVVSSLLKYVTDIDDVKGLGFCVSIDHARFMCSYFNEHEIPSMYLIGNSPDEDRNVAKQRLVANDVRFIFVVDIYNEGVDIPEVNTILFLRPTESLTIFLQQLGRGLRLSEGKDCLTVLDFIGQANRRYNFEGKFADLLSNTTRSIVRELKDGFISVPKGCYIQLERKAARYILENIKNSYTHKAGLLSRIATFEEDSERDLTLSNFLGYYHLDPRVIYSKKTTFYSLCAQIGIGQQSKEPLSESAYKILFKLSTLDSKKLISFLLNGLTNVECIKWNELTDEQQLMWKMFYVTVWERPPEKLGFANFLDGVIAF